MGRDLKKLEPVTRKNPKCATICKQCGRAFRYLTAYIKHETDCSKAEEEERKLLAKFNVVKARAAGNRRNLTPECIQQCQRCGRRFGSEREAALHIQKCRCRTWHYRCLSCDTIIKLKNGIGRHYATCTGVVQPNTHSPHKDIHTVLLTRKNAAAQCRFCKRLFLTFIGLKRHALSCSKQPFLMDIYKYVCKICAKEFLLRSVAERHAQNHENGQLIGGARLQPEQWGYSETIIDIDKKTLDRKAIAPLLIVDYRKELSDRRASKQNGLKAVSVFKIMMRKPTEDSNGENREIEVYFHSNPILVIEGNIRENVESLLDFIDNQIADYTTNGSGFVMTKVDSVVNKYYTYKQLAGGRNGDELLPKQFYTWGKVVNIQYADAIVNEDFRDQCFKHCLQLHEYKRGLNGDLKSVRCFQDDNKKLSDAYFYISVNDIHNTSLERYDMSCVKYPMPLKDIAEFQKRNPFVKINIFEMEHQDIELDDEASDLRANQYYLTPYYVSKVKNDDAINLLYWGKSSHFYYINNLEGLARMMRPFGSAKINQRSKLCVHCLQFIDTRYIQMEAHKQMCSENKPQQTIYPKPEAKWTFNRYGLMNKLGIFVVADFEASIIPVTQPPLPNIKLKNMPAGFNKELNKNVYKYLCDEAEFPYNCGKATRPVSIQRVNSVAYTLHVSDSYVHFPYDKMEQIGGVTNSFYASGDSSKDEEEVVTLFMNWLRECAIIVRDYLQQQNDSLVQAQQLQNLHKDPHVILAKTNTTICRYCRQTFEQDSDKFLDHDHCSASFRSFVHKKCNHKVKCGNYDEFVLNVFFHNFQSYDCCPILKYAKLNENVWKCRTRGKKVQMAHCGNLKFRDSYQLLPLSLEKVGKSLPSSACKYQDKLTNGYDHGKSIYPYEWMTSVSKFLETEFPTIDQFESSLSGPVKEKDYDKVKYYYNKHCTTFKQFHHHYLMRDVALLLDALLYWQDLMLNNFEIDLLQCESLPTASKEAMLQITREEPQLISDPVMLSYFSSNIRGGLTISSKRYVEIPREEHSKQQVKYFDFKSMYASMQAEKLPIGEFSFMQPIPTVDGLRNIVASHDYNGEHGYLCVVNTHIPPKLHPLLSDLPPIATKLSIDPGYYPDHSEWAHKPKSRVKKLIAHLFDVDNYGVSIQTLRFLLHIGVQITKVNCVIKFKQKAFMRPYIEILQKLRAKSKENGFEDSTLDILTKLLANSLFGKLIESPYNYEQADLVFARSNYEFRLRSNRFKSAEFYTYGALVKSKLMRIKLDKPVYAGMMVLDYAKLHLMSTYYLRILPAYIKCASAPYSQHTRIRVCYIDTDSLILHLHLNEQQQLKFYNYLHGVFDFSNLPEDHLLYTDSNMNRIGVLKDELHGRIIERFCTSGAKSYSITFVDTSGIPKSEQTEEVFKHFSPIIKCKSVPVFAQKQIDSEDFLKAFNDPRVENRKRVSFNAIRIGQGRNLYTVQCVKTTLNPNDSKRYVLPGNHDSLALGHYITLK